MRYSVVASAIAAACLAASAASAAEVTRTIEVGAPADKVWSSVSPDFCGIGTFHPAVEKCALSSDKMTRTLSLKGGGTIVEKQTAWDDKAHSYSYDIMESPLPVANYKSTFSIKDGGAGSTITWTSTFEPKGADEAAAKKVIDGIYAAGLDAIKAKI